MNRYRSLNIAIAFMLAIFFSLQAIPTAASSPAPALQCMGTNITNVVYAPWETARDRWLLSPWQPTAPMWMDTLFEMVEVLDRPPVSQSAMDAFNSLNGTDIWLGYPPAGMQYVHGQHGFDMPEDAQGYFRLLGTGDEGQDIEVWFVSSESTPETFYVLPFRTTELYAQPDGSNYGIHPCGAFAVPSNDVMLIVNDVLGYLS